MVIDNIELETEKMSLLPNKFYLIMTPSADGQAFDVTAYDTFPLKTTEAARQMGSGSIGGCRIF